MIQIAEKENENVPLKTDEIISILNKTNNKNFSKSNEISGNISVNFKRLPINEFAKKIDEQSQENPNNIKKTSEQKIEKKSLVEKNKENLDEVNKDIEAKIEIPDPKKYSEEEANKIATDLAKEYYDNGVRAGENNIKKELAKGEESISMALKNTIDNIFLVSPSFLKKLNENINKAIVNICEEVIGHQIKNLPEQFIEKIEDLVNSIEDSTNNVKLYLNKNDYNSIKNIFEKINSNSKITLFVDDSLQSGDLIIKSGGIEINNIVAKKIQMVSDTDITEEIENIKVQNQNIRTKKNHKEEIESKPSNEDVKVQNQSTKTTKDEEKKVGSTPSSENIKSQGQNISNKNDQEKKIESGLSNVDRKTL